MNSNSTRFPSNCSVAVAMISPQDVSRQYTPADQTLLEQGDGDQRLVLCSWIQQNAPLSESKRVAMVEIPPEKTRLRGIVLEDEAVIDYANIDIFSSDFSLSAEREDTASTTKTTR